MPRSWKTDSLPPLEGPGRLWRGDVKLLLLAVLESGPRHGYELMKAVEQLSGGRYVPSAGVVYPTLKGYAAQGLLRVDAGAERRRYALTAAGRKHLHKHKEALAAALKRLKGGEGGRPELRALAQEAQKLLREIFSHPDGLGVGQAQALRRLLAETTARARRIME